jgi:hypothetical protein
MRTCSQCGGPDASSVSLTPNVHESMCQTCRVSWSGYAQAMGCSTSPALSLVYFRRWQSGRERRVA